MRKRNLKFALFAIISLLFVGGMSGCLDQFDEAPPIVTILNPETGAVLDGVVPIVVTASDDKEVKTTRLFIDGREVTSVNGIEIRYDWDTGPIADNRQHFISAYAIDTEDRIGPSAITTVTLTDLSQDTLPQVVSVQNPSNGSLVSGVVNVAIGVNRQLNNPIDSVQIYIDGSKVLTDTQFPYLYPWDVSTLLNGSQHTIFAISYDQFGFNISSQVSQVTVNTLNFELEAPRPTVINPINRQVVQGVVNIACQVANIVEGNAIDSVAFVVDGFRIGTDTDVTDDVFFSSWDTGSLADGSSHSIFAVVYDQQQFNVSTGVITVTVNSDIDTDVSSPTVSIIFPDPTAGQNTFSVSQISSIQVVADAFDDTRVDSVQIYIDGVKQVTDTTPLYQYQWNFAGYATGLDHTIYVKAFDPSGNTGVAQLGVRLEP